MIAASPGLTENRQLYRLDQRRWAVALGASLMIHWIVLTWNVEPGRSSEPLPRISVVLVNSQPGQTAGGTIQQPSQNVRPRKVRPRKIQPAIQPVSRQPAKRKTKSALRNPKPAARLFERTDHAAPTSSTLGEKTGSKAGEKRTPSPDPAAMSAGGPEPPLVSNPRYLEPPTPPRYPPRAVRFGWQGTVIVRARVNASGKVEQVVVHRSSGHLLLDRAAVNAVRNWRFVPAVRGGRPVSCWVQVPVRFVLEGDP